MREEEWTIGIIDQYAPGGRVDVLPSRGESRDVTGDIPTFEVGCYGFSSWWWGIADALTNVLLSFDNDQLGERMAKRLENLSHLAENRHYEGCEVCEWWVEDVDPSTEWLNDHTPEGYLWDIHEGELFLSPYCGENAGSGRECTRDDCAHWDW